ncbi:unnamed protein product [Mytilus edulis]|uniref:Uncharacterized protein n=1 Tax=Mytilus edulis TaxID=6550 RepID=A0A8S3VR23_MYTED|nr:unnamed protein product [Mytilus edulis]
MVEDEESDNDVKANSSYKFTCKKLPKFTAFEDSGINVDDETLEVTIPDSLTEGLPSNNEVETKCVKDKVKKRSKENQSTMRNLISTSVKLYVAEELHEDVEKDDSPVPSHLLIETTMEETKVQETVNNKNVPISDKARSDRMSKIGKYSLRKRNKEKLKEAYKISDSEEEISSTQSSNSNRVNEQLQLTPDNITNYTPTPDEITNYTPSPDDITSYIPNNKDKHTTFEILENKDKTTKNSRHYTTTTVQKIDSSSCFGFESPRDDHRTDKSQNSKRSLLLLMSYSQSDTLLPCEKGDAGSDPYDFEAECNRQKGLKSSKVLQKKGTVKSKQQMSITKVKDDNSKKLKERSRNLLEHVEQTPLTLFNDDNTYQMKATKAPKKRSKGHNNKQKLYKEKKDSKKCKLNNSVSFKDECDDDKKQRKMQKEFDCYPGDIEETIDSDQLDPTNLQSVVFDEVSLRKISKRLSNMTSDDKSKATKELDNEDSSDSQEVRIGNILNQQSKLKSNCTSMPIDIDIGVEPAGSLDSQSPVHIQLKDSRRKKKKEVSPSKM